MKTATAFRYRFGAACLNNEVDVPAGLRVVPIKGEPGMFWVDDFAPFSAFDRHDAVHYGIRVSASNVVED